MRWSVVIPVFNERDFLPATLRSLAEQSLPFRLILIDNGSTDGCIEEARRLIGELRIDARVAREGKPGQVHALKRGIALADSEFVAICDADTWYPSQYLETAQALFDKGGRGRVALGALLLPEKPGHPRARLARWHKLGAAMLLPRQNHTSGAAQCFRLDILRRAGGYDGDIWPYVLKDHELMHRVLRHGSQAYHRDLWCISSPRRTDRRNVRWTLFERLAYHATPFALQRWFFHEFLASRFAARKLGDVCLRERDWEAQMEQRT